MRKIIIFTLLFTACSKMLSVGFLLKPRVLLIGWSDRLADSVHTHKRLVYHTADFGTQEEMMNFLLLSVLLSAVVKYWIVASRVSLGVHHRTAELDDLVVRCLANMTKLSPTSPTPTPVLPAVVLLVSGTSRCSDVLQPWPAESCHPLIHRGGQSGC